MLLSGVLTGLPVNDAQAGGGMVLQGDKCIIWIDFYSVHFTAYQPANHANKQFCKQLPDIGSTIFVLDYLHPSLSEVPVSIRIIRDVTGQGNFVKLKHVEAIPDIEAHSVFYQAPTVQADASLRIEWSPQADGRYIGIISAGHPGTDSIYTAVFPFEVGGSNVSAWLPVMLIPLLALLMLYLMRRARVARKAADSQEAG